MVVVESFTLQHGLDRPKGGLIIRSHNKIRDCSGDMTAMRLLENQWYGEGDPASNDPSLHLYLGIWGVLQPQVEALFDIHVIDADAPSYRRR